MPRDKKNKQQLRTAPEPQPQPRVVEPASASETIEAHFRKTRTQIGERPCKPQHTEPSRMLVGKGGVGSGAVERTASTPCRPSCAPCTCLGHKKSRKTYGSYMKRGLIADRRLHTGAGAALQGGSKARTPMALLRPNPPNLVQVVQYLLSQAEGVPFFLATVLFECPKAAFCRPRGWIMPETVTSRLSLPKFDVSPVGRARP